MLCQACGKRPATTHVKTIINGELTEYSLCSECAQKMGYENLMSGLGLNFGSLLGSFFGDSAKRPMETVRCPGCGSSFEDIAQSGKVGCAECYKTFYERLIPSIQRIHGNTKHCGKHPGGAMLQISPQQQLANPETELQRKKRELQEAVEAQNYEQAAVLRDEIKELEGGEKK